MSDTTVDTSASADNTTTSTGSNADTKSGESTASGKSDTFTPPASQDELNRIIAERVRRTEAKYAGYQDAIKKAEQFDAITEAQKSELQRAQDRAEAAEHRAQKLEGERQITDWKAAISKETGVPAGVLRGSTEEELLAHAESLKALIPVPDKRTGAYVAGEGRGQAAATDPAQQFAQLLRDARSRG